MKHWQVRRGAGEDAPENAPWSPAEFVLATTARLPLIKGAILTFKTSIAKLNRRLWPADQQPGALFNTQDVVDMLRAAPRRVDALLDSAVRAGAQTTLMIVKSWYPGLDLQALTGLRAGSEADVSAAWPAICHRTSDIWSMVNPAEYTPHLDQDGVPLPAATFSDLIHSTSSDDPNVTPEGACHTTSTSGSLSVDNYEDSGLNDEGSASSGAPASPTVVGKGKQSARHPPPSPAEEPSATLAGPSLRAPATGPPPTTTAPAFGDDFAA